MVLLSLQDRESVVDFDLRAQGSKPSFGAKALEFRTSTSEVNVARAAPFIRLRRDREQRVEVPEDVVELVGIERLTGDSR